MKGEFRTFKAALKDAAKEFGKNGKIRHIFHMKAGGYSHCGYTVGNVNRTFWKLHGQGKLAGSIRLINT